MEALGHHILLDLWGVPRDLLDSGSQLEVRLVAAASSGGATVVEARFHHFEPQGVSGIVVLAESHLAVHTWPELGYAAVDVFTCGAPAVAERVASRVVAALSPTDNQIRRLQRGPLRQRRVS